MNRYLSTISILIILVILNGCFLGFSSKKTEKTSTIMFDTLTTSDVKKVGDNLITHRISIYNNSYKKFSFAFGDNKNDLDTFSIEPQQRWNSPYSKKNAYVKVSAGKKSTIDKLDLGKRYSVIYIPAEKSWKFKEGKD